MTSLLDAYRRHRQQDQPHRGALNAITRRFSLPSPSHAHRAITREQWAEARRQPNTKGR